MVVPPQRWLVPAVSSLQKSWSSTVSRGSSPASNNVSYLQTVTSLRPRDDLGSLFLMIHYGIQRLMAWIWLGDRLDWMVLEITSNMVDSMSFMILFCDRTRSNKGWNLFRVLHLSIAASWYYFTRNCRSLFYHIMEKNFMPSCMTL